MREPRTYSGTVLPGRLLGTALGFPTANIALADQTLSGIYVGRVTVGASSCPAAVFANPRRRILEAHLLDFSQPLYGRQITIELYKKIRDKAAFDSDEALAAAIASDVAEVRAYFN